MLHINLIYSLEEWLEIWFLYFVLLLFFKNCFSLICARQTQELLPTNCNVKYEDSGYIVAFDGSKDPCPVNYLVSYVS